MSLLRRAQKRYAARCGLCGHEKGVVMTNCRCRCHPPRPAEPDIVIIMNNPQRNVVRTQRPVQKNPVNELGELLGVNRRHKKT